MKAGPIRISILTNASRARRELGDLGRTMRGLGTAKNAARDVFDYATFARRGRKAGEAFDKAYADGIRSKANLADQVYRSLFRQSREAQAPVGKVIPNPYAAKGLLGALRQYRALGGEARQSLADLNVRTARFEKTATDAYSRAGTKLQGYADTASRGVGRVKALALATAAVGLAARGLRTAGTYLQGAVKNASDLNETVSKAQNIFGQNTGDILKFGDNAARTLGLSKQAALENAAAFGDMFTQIGFAGKDAANLSKSTLQLAADLGSFNNLDVADVLDRIGGAYRGEYDALQKVVPNISAARVQTEALALSHKKTAGQLTAQDKALAVNAILLKDSSRAQGDFARTGDGLANSSRTIKASLSNLSAKIGTAVLPGVNALALAFRDKVLPILERLVDKYAPRVNDFFSKISTGGFHASTDLGRSFDALKTIGASLAQFGASGGTALADTLTLTGVVMGFLADNAGLVAKAMPYVVAVFVAYKLAVLAANVAALASVPLKVAEILVNRQLVRSNQALIASRAGVTEVTLAATTVESAGTAAKGRGVIATLASRAATLAASAAARAWAITQGALNLVLAANPIGLVVLGVVALIAVLVVVYKKSDAFRRIVNSAFSTLTGAVGTALGFVKNNWPAILAVLTGPVGLAIAAFRKHRDTIVGIFTKIKDAVVGAFDGIGGAIVNALKSAVNSAIFLLNAPIRAINAIAGKVPGVPTLPEIPALATGGIVTRPTLALVGEAGPEAVIPLNGRYGGTTTVVNLTVQAGVGDPAEIGRQVVRTLEAYQRRTGSRVLAS